MPFVVVTYWFILIISVKTGVTVVFLVDIRFELYLESLIQKLNISKEMFNYTARFGNVNETNFNFTARFGNVEFSIRINLVSKVFH